MKKKQMNANVPKANPTESPNISLFTDLEISSTTEKFITEAGISSDSFYNLLDPNEVIPCPSSNILINDGNIKENTDGNIIIFKVFSRNETLENVEISEEFDDIGSISRQVVCSTPTEKCLNETTQPNESSVMTDVSPEKSRSKIEASTENISKVSNANDSNKSTFTETPISLHSNVTYSSATSSEISAPEFNGTQNVNSESSYEESDKDSLFIQAAGKSSKGIRIYDKQHVCYYCYKPLSKLTRHLKTVHKSSMEVARLLALDPKSEEVAEGFMCLLRAGDYYHNCEVLRTKKGELILSRRPTKNELKSLSISDYGPCPKCLGFMLLNNMWHHVKYNCPNKDQQRENDSEQISVQRRDIRGESTALLCNINNVPPEYAGDILAKFKNDEISYTCKNDQLIVGLGVLMYEKFGRHQHEHIRQTMRQLARLVHEIKNLNPECVDIWACIKPKHFDFLIKAVKLLCQSSQDQIDREQRYGIPSLALKLGHNLKKCALIGRGVALRKGMLDIDREITSFLDIMGLEWSMRISSSALRTLRSNKLNTTELLPVTEDLITLNRYLDETVSSIMSLSENDDQFFVDNYFRFARAVLSRIVLFNKRRSGEVSKMKISQYASRPDIEKQNSLIGESLTPLEKEMCQRLVLVEVIGKSRALFKVPILLTQELKAAVDKLIKLRDLVPDIAADNVYVFPRGSNSSNYLRGHDCLRHFCSEIDLKSPHLITGTKLRKYIATAVQIFDLKEHEYDWLARHLGHDIRVHRNFYRLHESTVELTKVSRLLMAVDSGEAHKFKGQSLENINTMELPDLEMEDDVDMESGSGEDSDLETEAFGQKQINKKKKITKKVIVPKPSPKRPLKKATGTKRTSKKTTAIKRPWSSNEAEVVLKFFRENIKDKKVPGKKQCDVCIERYKNILGSRRWTDVKFFVKNHITKIRKAQN